jgi:hypothetical protein
MYFENNKQRQQYHACLNNVRVGDQIEFYVSTSNPLHMIPRTSITPYTRTELVGEIGYYPDNLPGRIGAHLYPRINLNHCYAVENMVLIKRIIKQQKEIQLKSVKNTWSDWKVIYSQEIF